MEGSGLLLDLKRPLVVLDLETTGLNVKLDRVVQIGVIKVYPNGTRKEWESLVNPNRHIAEHATACHGITDEMVVDAPNFSDLAPALYTGFKDVDFCGYNLRFDLDLINEEFKRCRIPFDRANVTIVDACAIFKMKHPRTLSQAVKEFLGEEHVEAHNALADCRATYNVLIAQLKRYTDLPRDVDELYALARGSNNPFYVDPDGKFLWDGEDVVLNFSRKHNGRKLREVAQEDPGFLRWMTECDFSNVVVEIVNEALQGRFPVRPRELA